MSITQVQTTGLTDSSVTSAKIANGAVGTTEIADSAVTAAKIAAGAVGTSEIAANAVTSAQINFGNALVPVGGIIMWTGITIPTGWALCNGANGTPNLIDRFIVGAANVSKTGTTSQTGTGSSPYNPGDTGGANSVVLTEAQLAAHSHTGSTTSNGAHTHTYIGHKSSDYQKREDGGNTAEDTSKQTTPYVDGNGAHSHTITTDQAGGGTAHENRPPYYALAFIMRTS